MIPAPERMWREPIPPSKTYPEGGSFYHEVKPDGVELVEYVRKDLNASRDEELLHHAFKGLLVLSTMLSHENLIYGVSVTKNLIKDILLVHPEFNGDDT